jgi:hypothetical protein
MLDNFERYRSSNAERIDDVQRRLARSPVPEPEQGNIGERPISPVSLKSSKRRRSPSTSDEEDKYTRRTRINFDALPWNEPEDSNFNSSTSLSPALQKTHTLLENFSRDVKRARSSLLNCNKPVPQFPQSEWLNLLNGYAIDLDHVFSNIYTISHNVSEIVELGKSVELLHGSSAPAKTVKTHGDWVITWDCLVEAILFVFKHRKSKLQAYGKHIQRFFASLPSQFHNQVISYDRAVCIRAAQRRGFKLSSLSEFADLQIQWISNPSVTTATTINAPAGSLC